MDAIDVMSVPVPNHNSHLGPMAGAWDGYGAMERESRIKAECLVGVIHMKAVESAQGVVAIGVRLIELKELLGHGQFLSCVKAEFGWSPGWARQLMQVGRRFGLSNSHSSANLPSSVKVLAELAAADASDEVVQQAAQEGWTVKETKRRLRSEKQRERTVVQEAMTILRLTPEAIALASKAECVSTMQVMHEMGLSEPPKDKELSNESHTYCKSGDHWWRFPLQQPVEVPATRVQGELSIDSQGGVVHVSVAAERLGKNLDSFRVALSPARIKARGLPTGNGWVAEPHPERGMCLLRRATTPPPP